MQGWLKLHRKLLSWRWYHDTNVTRLFIHLLLTANFERKPWGDLTIEPGQTVIGRKSLASDLQMSEQSLRTALAKLKRTNEIIIKSTNKNSLVTIVNWEEYQSFSESSTNEQPTNNQRTTSNQPAINQQSTTPKEVKKERNKERKNNKSPYPLFDNWVSGKDFAVFRDWLVNEEFEKYWYGFLEVRKKKRAPETALALEGHFKVLSIAKNNRERVEILKKSVERGYTGIFALDGAKSGGNVASSRNLPEDPTIYDEYAIIKD